jgi:UDP-N-acetylmuramoylalanine--D-glutamate ligase
MMDAKDQVLVLGMGASGRAAVRLLCAEGRRVWVVDAKDDAGCRAAGGELRALGADVRLGVERLPADIRPDLAVVSPGIPAGAPWLAALRDAGVPCRAELELGWSRRRSPVLAVTGSNGKSTTVAMLCHLLGAAGIRTEPAGNFGPPVSEVVGRDQDWLTLEVSSFQLECVHAFRPEIGVLLNLTPNHLDRHGTMNAYRRAKARLFACTVPEDLCIVHEDVIASVRDVSRGQGQWVSVGTSPAADYAFRDGRIHQRGRVRAELGACRWANAVWGPALAAIAAVLDRVGIDPASMAAGLASFRGLPHRMEALGSHRGVAFVNDSKATTLAALAAGVRVCRGPVRLLAGGMLKEPARAAPAPRVAAAYLIGRDAEALHEAWSPHIPCRRCGLLAAAFDAAWTEAQPGDTILLSPGAASFDQFTGFAQRGECFRALVNKVSDTHPAIGNSQITTECGGHRERFD